MDEPNLFDSTLSDFFSIPSVDLEQCQEGLKFMNEDKNRYPNVIPVDKTRVKVKSKGNDYINANFIDLSPIGDGTKVKEPVKMIATQGPVKNTEEDFWNMIFQYSVPVILMLTKTVEKQVSKCTKYWPSVGQKIHFPCTQISIENLSSELLPLLDDELQEDIIVSKFIVTKSISAAATAELTVHHIYYKGWPDFEVPDIKKIKTLLQLTDTFWRERSFPLVCHCSAGLGRTGTIAAIYKYILTYGVPDRENPVLLDEQSPRVLLDGEKLKNDVYLLVEEIRLQRHGMVQTKEQFQFIIDYLKKA